jgi:hypothetical protein
VNLNFVPVNHYCIVKRCPLPTYPNMQQQQQQQKKQQQQQGITTIIRIIHLLD